MTTLRRTASLGSLIGLVLFAGASAVSADTLLMPKRDMLAGTAEVVWGVTTQPNHTVAAPTTYAFDFENDGTVDATGNVTDRSYIAVQHTYPGAGTFTAKLTVTRGAIVESATVEIRVFSAAALTPADLRGLNINRAIQDGLRWLWTAQNNRTGNFPAGTMTSWGAFQNSTTALVVLAFENHGYLLPSDDSAPTGLYERFIVQRGMNWVVDKLFQQSLGVQPAGDPCVGGVGAAPCVGLFNNEQPGYGTAITALPLAGSNALLRHVPAGLGANNAGFVAGKTFGEILQRLINTIAWGQNEGHANPAVIGRGGWIYGFSNNAYQQSDGSTIGWDILALLDAEAAGINAPAFVRSEFQNFALPQGFNTDGTFDYRADGSAVSSSAGNSLRNAARTGIALQGLFYVGQVGPGDPQVAASRDAINSRWAGTGAGDYNATCGANKNNKGCAYAMFNIFKGLKLHGITSLAAAADWYGEYQDWLVANQTSPNTPLGGNWQGQAGTTKVAMSFSCCHNDHEFNAAIAELILSPVALITPDPGLFSTVGLAPATAQNAVGTTHTVTATAQSATGTPVAGATVNFQVTSGPHAGASGQDVTDANGQATFTYTGTAAGSDKIQAFIGSFGSNVVDKLWLLKCDADVDNDVDTADLGIIRAANGQTASSALDPRDGNSDGSINVADARYCQLRCTRPSCAQ